MHKTLLPEGWPRPKGYANGVILRAVDDLLWRADRVDEHERFEHHDFIGQFRQALENVVAILGSAGAGGARHPHDLVCHRPTTVSS